MFQYCFGLLDMHCASKLSISCVLAHSGMTRVEVPHWIPLAEQAIGLIYKLAEHPDTICANVIKSQAAAIKAYGTKTGQSSVYHVPIIQHRSNDKRAEKFAIHKFFFGSVVAPTDSEDDSAAVSGEVVHLRCPTTVVTRFLFVCGHVALQELIHLDVAIFSELKRRRAVQEQVTAKTSRRETVSVIGSTAPSVAASTVKAHKVRNRSFIRFLVLSFRSI